MFDEVYYLTKYAGFSRNEIYEMPVYERRYHLDKLIKDVENQTKGNQGGTQTKKS